jgi:hypothetical protein
VAALENDIILSGEGVTDMATPSLFGRSLNGSGFAEVPF